MRTLHSRPARFALVAMTLTACIFLVPIGRDADTAERVFDDRIETYEVPEYWSIGSVFVFGEVSGDSHLTGVTIALGVVVVLGLSGITFLTARGIERWLCARNGSAPLRDP